MRVVSISVNGLHKAAENGFFEWMVEQNADVICVQDLLARAYEFDDPKYNPEGYHAYFIDGEEISDGGVAIYTRHFPKAIMYGFAHEASDRQGRFLQADFENVSVASILAPNALDNPDKQAEKDEFFEAFMGHLQKTLRKRRQFIFAGNFQTAHLVTDASSRWHKMEVSGFLPHERAWFDEVFDSLDYVDAFREVNKASKQYSWWPEWAKGWRKQSGWRTDYQIATPGLRPVILDGFIDNSIRFSDHGPVIIDYDIVMP